MSAANELADITGDKLRTVDAAGGYGAVENPVPTRLHEYLMPVYRDLGYSRFFIHLGKFGATTCKPICIFQVRCV